MQLYQLPRMRCSGKLYRRVATIYCQEGGHASGRMVCRVVPELDLSKHLLKASVCSSVLWMVGTAHSESDTL